MPIKPKAGFGIKEKQLSAFLKLLIHMRNQVNDSVELDRKINEIRGKFNRVVTEELVRELVAQKVGLPLQKLQESERELLNNLEARLSEKIIGQEKSIRSLCQAVRRGRVRLGNESRPAGVFLMLGPTGVGKTASVLALSELLYGSKDHMLRLDMSEYNSSADINKLIGAPPGYIGYETGGKLTNWLRKKPFSIVLLDEIEKAHSSVFDLLLQVFDAGRLTDGNNETVQCVDTIFVMTSNLGAQLILENHKKLRKEQLHTILEELMNEIFRSEFINRFQEVMIFDPLTEQEISQVAQLQCQELQRRVEKNVSCPNLKMTWDPSVVQFLVNIGYSPKKGAREISRHITRLMENQISDLIVQGKIRPGAQIHFKSDGKAIELSINELYAPSNSKSALTACT
jgi:ATP-dependent Clp protease ATP-binding subunit ClpA